MALDAPAVPTAWEERVRQNTSETAARQPATAPSRPIVAAAPRRQSITPAPHPAATDDRSNRATERQPNPPVKSTPTASRPIVNSPPPHVRSHGYDERRVVTATRPPASSALAELWSSNSPRQTYRTHEEPDERTDLRIVSEVKPLPPVQPRPVVHPVEMRHDSIVVRGDQIKKLPAIKTAPPVRSPVRLADGPPVVRPALRR